MRKFNKQTFLQILSIFFVACLLYGLWVAISFFVSSLASANPKISASIIGGMTTVFVGLAAVIITQRQTKQREIEEAHREKKVEIYQKYIDTIASLIAGQNDQVTIEAPSEQELIDYLFSFKTQILLWGSPKVIKTQLEFEKVSNAKGNVFLAINNLYKAIREDIGLSNAGLNNMELFKLFLKDPEELDKIRGVNQ